MTGPDFMPESFALYPAFTEKVMWGGKAVGLRVALAVADAQAVKHLIRQAWEHKSDTQAVPRAPAAGG